MADVKAAEAVKKSEERLGKEVRYGFKIADI